MTVDEVRRVRSTQVIKDPFPDHSTWEQFKRSLTPFQRIFGMLPESPEHISIWAAYQQGYDRAYEEMLAAADLMPDVQLSKETK